MIEPGSRVFADEGDLYRTRVEKAPTPPGTANGYLTGVGSGARPGPQQRVHIGHCVVWQSSASRVIEVLIETPLGGSETFAAVELAAAVAGKICLSVE